MRFSNPVHALFDAPRPIVRLLAGVGDGDDDDLVRKQFKHNHEGESPQKRPPDVSSGRQCFESREPVGSFLDAVTGDIVGCEQSHTDPLFAIFVPQGRLIQLLFHLGKNAHDHVAFLAASRWRSRSTVPAASSACTLPLRYASDRARISSAQAASTSA